MLINMETIGERVRRLREVKKLTQRQLGMRAGTSGSYVSQLEAGILIRPGVVQLTGIAAVLQVPLQELVSGATAEDQPRVVDPRLQGVHLNLLAIEELDQEEFQEIVEQIARRKEKLERERKEERRAARRRRKAAQQARPADSQA
jgi:transcriptional regulator with XRE-family HTH domain